MSLSKFFPPDIVEWLLRYGLFLAICVFVGLVVLVLFRPFWLWFSGQSEVIERLRRIAEDERKSLFELEMLNKTPSIPLKKVGKKVEPEAEGPPLDTSGFLKELEKTRKKIKEEEKTGEDE